MSTVTATYPVKIHTDSSVADSKEHRLAVIRWKDKKDDAGKVIPKHAARCVSIPAITLAATPACLASLLQEAFEEMQESIIREKIEGMIAEKVAFPAIAADAITADAVAAYAAEKAASGKLSGKSIESWFDTSLQDALTLKLSEVMKLPEQPTAEQLAQLDAAIKQHRSLLSSLASPRAAMPEVVAKQLQRAVELATDDSKTKQQVAAKLTLLLTPKEVTLAFGLGE